MADYFVSNTLRFFHNGESDMLDLLEMIERYNNPEGLDRQVEILNTLFTVETDREISKYRMIPEQYDAWDKIFSIMSTWDEAWVIVLSKRPALCAFCGSKVAKSFLTIIS